MNRQQAMTSDASNVAVIQPEIFEEWHVGRQGEASCGMTQVVNAYLGWTFDHCRVGVIESRNGSRGMAAIWVFLRSIFALLKLNDPHRQMVVVHLSQGGSFVREGLLLVLARMRGLGVIAHLHGSRFVDFSSRWPMLTRGVLKNASRIIVLSEATQAVVNVLVPNVETVLVPNAVVAGKRVPKQNTVLFGGAVSHRKGVDVLLAAWSRIESRGSWTLKIAGPVDEEFRSAVLPEGVQMCGPLPHVKLMAEMERSSIAVLPSRDEAMPMFILEAMARCNCVISTRVGGIPKVLGGGAGLLIDPGNVDQLTEALERVIGNDDLRQSLSNAAFECYDTFYSARAVYGHLESLWRSVLIR